MSLIPGSPDLLDGHIRDLEASVELIEQAIEQLTLVEFDLVSLSAAPLESKVDETSQSLSQVQKRHSGTGVALTTYSTALRQAQKKADQADEARAYHQNQARIAGDQLPSLRTAISDLEHADAPTYLIQRAEEERTRVWQAQVAANNASLEATKIIEQARQEVDRAADTAIAGIKSATSQTNDKVIQKIGHLLNKVGDILASVGEWVAKVLSKILTEIYEILKVVAKGLLVVVAIVAVVALAVLAVQLLLVIVSTVLFKVLAALTLTLIASILLWEITRPPLDVREFVKPHGESEEETSRREAANKLNEFVNVNHQSVSEFMNSQSHVDSAGATETGVIDVKLMSENPPRWVVTLPSTQDWMGGAPNDWAHNVMLKMFPWYETQTERAIRQAMSDAGISSTDEVALIGFSQAGILAGRLSANENSGFNITRVVTSGAPVGDIPIPKYSTQGEEVKVVSFEHKTSSFAFWKNDPVWGLKNPFNRHSDVEYWQTYSVPPKTGETFGAAHNANLYAQTARELEKSNPAINETLQDFYGEPIKQIQFQITE